MDPKPTISVWDAAAIFFMTAVGLETGQLVGFWPGPHDPRWFHLVLFVVGAIIIAVAARLTGRR